MGLPVAYYHLSSAFRTASEANSPVLSNFDVQTQTPMLQNQKMQKTVVGESFEARSNRSLIS